MILRRLLLLLVIATSPVLASIARDGSCEANTTACTLSGTATGDIKVVIAVVVSGTPPSLPGSGWTNVTSATIGGVLSYRVGCNVSSSSADTGTGTWTSASRVAATSYSGTAVGTTGNCNTTGIGGAAANGATSSTTLTCSGLTLNVTNGTSWVGCLMGSNGVFPGACAPTGMTNVINNNAVQIADTNAGVSSWSAQTCSITSGNWSTYTLEILSAAAATAHTQVGAFVPGP